MQTYKCVILGTLFRITEDKKVYIRTVSGEFVKLEGSEKDKINRRIAKNTVRLIC